MRPRISAILTVLGGWAFVAPSAPVLAADSTLKVAVTAFPPAGPDPRKSVSVFATYTWSPIYEALTTFREDGTLVGELAESWRQLSPTAWSFTLRPGVVFSNGRPLTAADVAANIMALKRADSAVFAAARQIETIVAARAADERTLIVETVEPNAIVPRELSAIFVVLPEQLPATAADAFPRAPIGTGPFVLTDWDEGLLTYAPNSRSWRPPRVAGLEIRLLPESTTRLQALLTGKADIAIGMGPDEQPTIAAAGGRLHRRQPIDVISLAFVIGNGKPVDDVRVRRALNYAVDKEAIADVILQGTTRPASQGAVQGLLGYDPDLKPYPYDPAKARALLTEAGYDKGFTLDIEVIVSSNAGDALIYQYVAENLASVGVKLNLISIPTPQMMRVVNQGEWKGDGFSQVFGAWPTFEPLRTLRLHSCLWPKPWYCDPAIMPTLNAARTAPTLEERARLTREVLRFYHDQATSLLLHEIPVLDGVARRVKNYDPQKGKINYETIEVAN